jgi:pimeloyl-ACP methyl ester carboxylesterase
MLDVGGLAGRAAAPFASMAKAAIRPESYPGHAREAVSLAVTAAVWPFGLVDEGIAEIRRLVADGEPEVPTPVLLIHGFAANKSNWFFLRRDLRSAGFGRVHALNYNPFRADIPAIAAGCVQRARDLMAAAGTDRIHLVGHSLGGLVARYAVQLGGLHEAATCSTVASPHQGVAPARLASWPMSVTQLRPDAQVLQRLRASSRHLPTRFVAYYSNLDVLVPGHRAMIVEPALRATNVLIRDEGHLSILLSRRLSTSLLHELAVAEGLAGTGSALRSIPPAA